MLFVFQCSVDSGFGPNKDADLFYFVAFSTSAFCFIENIFILNFLYD